MKILLFYGALLVAHLARAQQVNPFKVNLSVGYAQPAATPSSAGLSLSIEPKYGLSSQMDLGLRLETALTTRYLTSTSDKITGQSKGISSALLTSTYLLTQARVRPFIGVGVGIFALADAQVTYSDGYQHLTTLVKGGTKVGGVVRAGIKTGHLQASVEFNLVAGSSTAPTLLNGQPYRVNKENSYGTVKLGFDLGGGHH